MPQNSETLVTQWLDYLSQQGKSAATIIAYRRGVQHFMRWVERTYDEEFDVVAVVPRDIEHWKTEQVKTLKSAPATINQRLVAVSGFFNWCIAEHLITQSPLRSVKAIRLDKHTPQSIPLPHLNRLLRAVHQSGHLRDVAIIEVLSGTGIRVGELLDLQVSDLVDLEKRSAHLIVRQGKHGNYRTLPLTRLVRQALVDYLTHHPRATEPNTALWLGRRGALTQSSSILRLLDKYCLQSNLEKITPHQLRHTFATRYLDRNPDDLRGLAALLGHSDLNTVMLYTEPSLETLVERMESFD